MENKERAFALKVALVLALLGPSAALAYLDPGSGSLLLQGLIALIAGVLTTLGVYWRATVAFVRRLFGKRPVGERNSDSDAH